MPTMYPDSTFLRFDFSIPYEDLIFMKRENDYFAGIKFNLFVTDDDRNTFFEQSWNDKIIVNSYEETHNDSSYHQPDLIVLPLRGNLGKKASRQERKRTLLRCARGESFFGGAI